MDESSDEKYLLLNQLAEEFSERKRRGERPTLDEYCERHPDLADDLREIFVALGAVELSHDDLDQAESITPPFETLGDFRLIRELGRGGMGVVYEAEQISLARRVALKVLTRRSFGEATRKRRFEREARAAGRLHHTNIIPVYGFGEHDGTPYFIMQLIDGVGLDAVIAEVRRIERGESSSPSPTSAVARSIAGFAETSNVISNNGSSAIHGDRSTASLSTMGLGNQVKNRRPKEFWRSVARIGAQVADALDYAHRQGVVHRDVKPSNILLDASGNAWVADFGLAKADDADNLTESGDLLGTLRYLPPEAFQGQSTARSDVYSLGLTLWELAALRPAFSETDQRALMQRVAEGSAPRLSYFRPDVPRDLETILTHAIDRDPKERYANAAEFADDLRRFISDEPIRARPPSALESLGRWARRNRGVATLMGVSAALLVMLAVTATAAAIMLESSARLANQASDRAVKAAESADSRANRLAWRSAQAQAEAGDIDSAMHSFARLLENAPPASEEQRLAALALSAWRPRLWPRVYKAPKEKAIISLTDKEVVLESASGIERVDLSNGKVIDGPIQFGDYTRVVSINPDHTIAVMGKPAKDDSTKVEIVFVDLKTRKQITKPSQIECRLQNSYMAGKWFKDILATVVRDRSQFGAIAAIRLSDGQAIGEISPAGAGMVQRLGTLKDGTPVALSVPRFDPIYPEVPPQFEGSAMVYDQLRVRDLRNNRYASVPVAFSDEMCCELPTGRGVAVIGGSGMPSFFRANDGKPLEWIPFAGVIPISAIVNITGDSRIMVAPGRDRKLRWFEFGGSTTSASSTYTCFSEKESQFRTMGSPSGQHVALTRHSRSGASEVFRTFPFVSSTLGGATLVRDRLRGSVATWRASFSPDGKYVFYSGIAGGAAEFGQVRNAETGATVGLPFIDVAGGPHRSGSALSYSHDGSAIASSTREIAGRSPLVRIWDGRTAKPLTAPVRMPTFLHSIKFAPNRQLALFGCVNGIGFVEPESKTPTKFVGARGPWKRFVFSPDGKFAVASNGGGWGSPLGIHILDLEKKAIHGKLIRLVEDTWLTFTDNRTLLGLDFVSRKRMHIDVQTGEMTEYPFGSETPEGRIEPTLFDIDPVRNRVAVVSYGQETLKQIDLSTFAGVANPIRDVAPITAVRYVRKGEFLATGHDDGAVRLWDARSGEPVGPKFQHYSSVLDLIESGDRLRVATMDRKVREWRLPSPIVTDAKVWKEWLSQRASDGPFDHELADSLDRQIDGEASTESHNEIAWLKQSLSDAEEAFQPIACLQYATKLAEYDPKQWWWHFRRGAILDQLDRPSEAEVAFKKAVEQSNPEEVSNALVHAACDATFRKETELSERYFARAFSIWKPMPDLYYHRCYCRDARGDVDGAAKDLADCVRMVRSEHLIHSAAENARLRRDHHAVAVYLSREIPGVIPWSFDRTYYALVASLLAGDRDIAKSSFERLTSEVRKLRSPSEAHSMAVRASVLAPEYVTDWQEVLRWAELSILAAKNHFNVRYRPMMIRHANVDKAGALIRFGRHAEGLALVESDKPTPEFYWSPGLVAPLKVMALHAMGKTAEAKKIMVGMRVALNNDWEDIETEVMVRATRRFVAQPADNKAAKPAKR